MKVLKSKHYQTFMYISISILTLSIILSFANLYSDYVNNNIEIKSRIDYFKVTGHSIENISIVNNLNNSNNSTEDDGRLYSENIYGLYYLMIIAIGIIIFLVAAGILLPRYKHLT